MKQIRQLGAYHPVFGYHFVPGLRTRIEHEGGGYLVQVNQQGFRCSHEFTPAKRPGTSRLLLFGDSFTAGAGVSNKDRFGDLLEHLIPGLEVFNFGLPGSGPDEQLLIYRSLAQDIDHDVVVIAVWVENIWRIVMRWRMDLSPAGDVIFMPKPYFLLDPDGQLHHKNDPVPKRPLSADEVRPEERAFMRRVTHKRAISRLPPRVKTLIQAATRHDLLPAYRRADHPDWLLLKAILQQWTSELSRPCIIMPLPMPQHVEGTMSPRHYRRRFRELAAAPKVVVHDPLPGLRGLPRDERRALRFESDIHPTPLYHRLLAASLARPVRAALAGESS